MEGDHHLDWERFNLTSWSSDRFQDPSGNLKKNKGKNPIPTLCETEDE
jgi:hypothetical protein